MRRRGSRVVDLRQRFVERLRSHDDGHPLELSPTAMSQTVAWTVGAAGGGLSLVQPLVRLPIGASDPDAVVAEQVQASVGSGPCLEAATSATALGADEAELEATWPMYHRFLTGRTRFRSVAAFPLRQAGGHVFAVLDLYGEEPDWRPSDGLPVVQEEVADLVGMMLIGSILGKVGSSAWPGDVQARRRQQVWVSVGMVCEAARVGQADAMAMLRAYAFSHDQLLDDVASELLSGQLLPEALVGDG